MFKHAPFKMLAIFSIVAWLLFPEASPKFLGKELLRNRKGTPLSCAALGRSGTRVFMVLCRHPNHTTTPSSRTKH